MSKLAKHSTLRVLLYFSILFFSFLLLTFFSAIFIKNKLFYDFLGRINIILSLIVAIYSALRLEGINLSFIYFNKLKTKAIIFILIISFILVFVHPIFSFEFYKSFWKGKLILTRFEFKGIGIFTFLFTIIVIPILEEILYRGIFIKILKLKHNTLTSIIIPSILFSLFHMNVNQLIPAFAFGVILGYIYYKTENLLICILIHGFTNFFMYFSNNQLVDKPFYGLFLLIALISLFLCIRQINFLQKHYR